uniref:Uncharacterized protein n=1 Tax=Cacopsylla melanoneura TaxID=428564 RepID=A0A8D8XNX8_9HEMI
MGHISDSSWQIPEADVNHLRFKNQIEFVGHRFDLLDHVVSKFHQTVDLVFKSFVSLGSPLQPKLEDIIVTTTLNDFVTSVVPDVIHFVLHEQIVSTHLITRYQQAVLFEVDCGALK